jgi:hypothetical protein
MDQNRVKDLVKKTVLLQPFHPLQYTINSSGFALNASHRCCSCRCLPRLKFSNEHISYPRIYVRIGEARRTNPWAPLLRADVHGYVIKYAGSNATLSRCQRLAFLNELRKPSKRLDRIHRLKGKTQAFDRLRIVSVLRVPRNSELLDHELHVLPQSPRPRSHFTTGAPRGRGRPRVLPLTPRTHTHRLSSASGSRGSRPAGSHRTP